VEEFLPALLTVGITVGITVGLAAGSDLLARYLLNRFLISPSSARNGPRGFHPSNAAVSS